MDGVINELRELQAWLIFQDQPEFFDAVKAAIAALSAPPEPKTEPVAWKCDALISMDPDDVEYWTTKGFPVTPLYAHPPAPPEGWVMVPREPTDAMEEAGLDADDTASRVDLVWSVMISAAPPAPETPE